jgi:short-subunit dehydrogenase
LPKILERGNGDIVKISSWVGWVDALNLSAYAASKFGLRGFGESLAVETAKRNVQVPNVYPSFSRTPILDSEQIGMVERKLVPIT